MRTTIVVEDAASALESSGSAPVLPGSAAFPGSAAVETAPPLDAGSAPVDEGTRVGRSSPDSSGASSGASQGASQVGFDGGMPPSWLVEAVAAAGGMSAPFSPEDIELAGLDAGAAPA